MKKAAVGFRVHSGWSAVVAVCLEKGSPAVLHRERARLVEEFTYRLRQPYHTGEKMALEEGREFISSVRAKAQDLAYRALHGLQAELKKRGYDLGCGALLLASGRPLPELEKVLASHAMIHTADGELFRESLAHASERCGVTLLRIKDRELVEQASKAFRLPQPDLLRRATEMGRPLGAPWSQDEKYAALAAWLVLFGGRGSLQRTRTGKGS